MASSQQTFEWQERILAAVHGRQLRLPGLPEQALRIRQIADRPDVSARLLASAIAEDPVIATRVVHLANSAAMARGQSVTRLDRAIMRIGIRPVLSLVIGLCLLRQIASRSSPVDAYLQRLYRHSIEVAAIARELATLTDVDPQSALLAGLVHDVGMLPLLDFATLNPELLADPPLLESLLDRLHPRLGARVLLGWRFPAPLITVVSQHEQRLRRHDGSTDLLDVIIAANVEARERQRLEILADRSKVPALSRFGLDTQPLADRTDAMARVAEVRKTLHAA
jgi:putative nucleotidyltransferase with HDIG domain